MVARIALRCCEVTGVSPVLGIGAFGLSAEGNGVAPAPGRTVVVVSVAVAVEDVPVVDMEVVGGGGFRKPVDGEAVGARLRVGPVGSWRALKFLFVRRVLGGGSDI